MEDIVEGRIGSWMQTSLGGKFFPLDPRPEEIFISDIANGLALDCRYAGQGRVDRYYSVAEHSYHMAMYSYKTNGMPGLALAILLHDAAEAYLNDLPRAVKLAAGDGYKGMEERLQLMICGKYQVLHTYLARYAYIKDLDNRMVPLEKAAILRHPQPWVSDRFQPLSGVEIRCFAPVVAKRLWLEAYFRFASAFGNIPYEEIEI